jgi:hypothetical protein
MVHLLPKTTAIALSEFWCVRDCVGICMSKEEKKCVSVCVYVCVCV